MATMSEHRPLGVDAINALTTDLTGEVITPDHAEYDAARRVFYTGFDRRPAAIVRPANASDVSRAVSVARDSGLELAVRSGGHSPAGHGVSDGGVVIDLSAMHRLDIDPERRTAWVDAGMTAGDYVTAAAAHGLTTGFGDTGSVGIGGITLAGGVGYLVRKYGLTIDDVLAAEVVTANGEVLHVDADSHADLFWAIRGGGGNFGVVTRLQFRLHPVEAVIGGMLMLPATPEVLSSAIAEAEAATDDLSTIINVTIAPPLPFVPAEHHGRPVVIAAMIHASGGEAGERAVAPFKALASPIVDMIRPMRYAEIYALGEAPRPPAVASRPMFVETVQRESSAAILEHLTTSTAPIRAVQLRVLGGAMARVPADATAFAHRGRRIMLNIFAGYMQPAEEAVHESWASNLAAALPQTVPGAYVGFIGDAGEAPVREAYPGSTWERLAAIKARYDPTNLFRLNQNVRPAADSR